MTPEAEPGRARAGAWATTTLTETGRRALVAGAVATSFCLAYAAVTLAPAGSGVASWWPAAGVSTAALLVARRWRWVALALALTTCSANVLAGRPLVLAVIFGLANAVEAVLVAEVLTRRRTAPARLDGVRDVARLMGAAAAGAVVLGLVAATGVVLVLDGSFLATARSSGASHAASNLVVLPFVLLVLLRPRAPHGPRRPRAPGGPGEAAGQVVCMTVAVGLVFGPGQTWPTSFLLFPLLVWASWRFSPALVAAELLGLSVAVSVLTASGAGPFAAEILQGGSRSAVGALVQTFVVAAALVAMPLVLSAAERRQDVADLATASRLTEAVLDSEPVLVVLLDERLAVRGANAAARDLSGDRCTVGTHLRTTGLVGDPVVHDVEGWVERVCDARSGLTTTVRLPGGLCTLLWSGRRVDLRASSTAFLLTALDVTHHQLSETFLRRVMEATTGTVVVGTDERGTITFWNAGAQHLLGWTADEVVGLALGGLVATEETPGDDVADDPRVPGATSLPGVEHGGPDVRRDWAMAHRDGGTRLVSVTVDAMRAPGGEALGFVAVGDDVTEHRRAERRLHEALDREQRAVERLAEANRIKDDLVATVSHELRTPLTNVLGYTHLLRSRPALGAQEQRWVARIEQNGTHLLELIEDLLLLAQVESPGAPTVHEDLDLTELLRVTFRNAEAELVDDRRQIGAGEPVHLTARLRSGIRVRGDARQVDRAVRNLLSNAVKFSPHGGRVRLDLVATTTDAVITVSDEGIGIDPADLDRVFEPFVRGSSAETAGIGGTGLGLGIVRAVADAHGGRATASRGPTRGTTVTLTLPLATAQPTRPATTSSSTATSKGFTR